MTPELTEALKRLRDVLQNECNPHTVAVEIFINSEGYELNYKLRTPGSLKRDGISMKNICGDYIKESVQ
jgi:hypothetical protein